MKRNPKDLVNFKVITGIDDFPTSKQFLFHRLGKTYNDDFIQSMVDQLDGYKFIPEPSKVNFPKGCFVRNMTKFTHDLKAGGFVLDQNEKWLTLMNSPSAGERKQWKVDLTKMFIFLKEKTKVPQSKFRTMLEKLAFSDYP